MRQLYHNLDEMARQLQELGVDLKDLEETFSRSAGPGGQNVNKVETAVRLRHSPSGLEVGNESCAGRADRVIPSCSPTG